MNIIILHNDLRLRFLLLGTIYKELWKENGRDAGDLTALTDDQKAIVEKYINEKLSISNGTEGCEFKIIGHESLLTGTVNFYLESTEIQISNTIKVEFKVLMEHYEFQQNKMTLYYSGQPYTLAFTQGAKTQTIQLENITK